MLCVQKILEIDKDYIDILTHHGESVLKVAIRSGNEEILKVVAEYANLSVELAALGNIIDEVTKALVLSKGDIENLRDQDPVIVFETIKFFKLALSKGATLKEESSKNFIGILTDFLAENELNLNLMLNVIKCLSYFAQKHKLLDVQPSLIERLALHLEKPQLSAAVIFALRYLLTATNSYLSADLMRKLASFIEAKDSEVEVKKNANYVLGASIKNSSNLNVSQELIKIFEEGLSDQDIGIRNLSASTLKSLGIVSSELEFSFAVDPEISTTDSSEIVEKDQTTFLQELQDKNSGLNIKKLEQLMIFYTGTSPRGSTLPLLLELCLVLAN